MDPVDDVVTITTDGQSFQPTAAPAPAEPVAVDPALADVAVLQLDADEDDDKWPKQAKWNDDGTVTLPLFVPVTLRWRSKDSEVVNEEPTISTLIMRRLNGKDFRMLASGGKGDKFVVELTGACCRGMQEIKPGRWPLIFDKMDAADSQAAALVAQYFLANGPKTPGG